MSGRMSAEQTPDIAALAAVLAERHGCNVENEDTGRLLTCQECAETAQVLAPVLDAARRKARAAELRAWISEWPTTTGDGTFLATVARDGLARADRITEPASHEAATSGKEA